MSYAYHPEILDALAAHGVCPGAATPPARAREVVRDLYKYEIRRLRAALLDGRIEKKHYAGAVVQLRRRYWVLSVPPGLWTIGGEG